MEFGHEQNRHDWYSEVDKPNRLVYFQLKEGGKGIEDVDAAEHIKQDRTAEFGQKFENYAANWEKNVLGLDKARLHIRKDKHGSGVNLKSSVDMDVDAMIEEAIEEMRQGNPENDADAERKISLGFFRSENKICELLLGKATLSAKEYQSLMEAINACDKIEQQINGRIDEREADIKPYRELGNAGIAARYQYARAMDGNRLSSAIKALTNSEYKGTLGLGLGVGIRSRKGTHERRIGNLEMVRKTVQEKKGRLETKKAEYDKKKAEVTKGLDKAGEAVQMMIDNQSRKFSKILSSEFNIKLDKKGEAALAEILAQNSGKDQIAGEVIIRGESCKSMDQLLDALNKIHPLDKNGRKEKIEGISKKTKEFMEKKAKIEARRKRKGFDRFSENVLKENKETLDSDRKWAFIFERMQSILGKEKSFDFTFGANEMLKKKGGKYRFEVTENKGNNITIKAAEATIRFYKDKGGYVLQQIEPKTRTMSKKEAVQLIESLKVVQPVNGEAEAENANQKTGT